MKKFYYINIHCTKYLIILTNKKNKKNFMGINNYWSKKSPKVANDIFKRYLGNNHIIMDPFLGSGTSLQGIKELDINIKFIGVELNQMPLI
tara:strand:+ start:133 stop:405 length:273 start_codon:yes stop_codon:yes gene_type:complete